MGKIIAWVIGVLLVLLVALFLIVPIIANQKLDAAIERGNQDGNVLTVGERDLQFRLTSFNLLLDSIVVDQDRNTQRYTGDVGRLELRGLKIIPLLSGKYRLGDLLVNGAHLEMRPGESTKDTTDRPPLNLSIKNIDVQNGSFDRFSADGDLETRITGVSADGALSLPLAPASAPPAIVRMDSLYFPSNGKSEWSLSGLELDARAGEIRLGRAMLSPKMTAPNFLSDLEYLDDWLAIRIDSFTLPNFPFAGAAAGAELVLPAAVIGDFNLSVYENPKLKLPPNAQRKPFIVEQLRKLEREVLLEELTIRRANLSYGVMQEDRSTPKITFDDGTVVARNLSTYVQADSATIDLDFTFEGSSPLTARFALDQAGDGRSFGASGQLGKYDLTRVNPLMIAAAGAYIDSGNLDKLNYTFSSDGAKSSGELFFRYRNLDVNMEGSFIKDLAADIAVRKSNPRPGGDLVMGTVNYQHDPQRSFFSFYWKSLLSGLKSSAMGDFFQSEEKESEEM